MDTFEKIIIPLIGILVSILVAYLTARKVYKSQIDNGKVLLLEIIKRYVINVHNNFDENAQVKTDPINKAYYLSELEAINSDLKELFTNPLLIKIFKKHSGLTMLTINLRREIAYLKQANSKSGIRTDTLRSFIALFDAVKSEYKEEIFKTDKNLKEISEIINFLRSKC
jgi:hypothetical protein